MILHVQSWFRSMYLFYIFLSRFSILITFLLQQIWHGKVNDISIFQDAEVMQRWKIGLKLAAGVKITEVNRFFFSPFFKKKTSSMILPLSWATVSSHSGEFLMHSFLRTFPHSFLHNNNTDWTFSIIKRLIQLLFVAITMEQIPPNCIPYKLYPGRLCIVYGCVSENALCYLAMFTQFMVIKALYHASYPEIEESNANNKVFSRYRFDGSTPLSRYTAVAHKTKHKKWKTLGEWKKKGLQKQYKEKWEKEGRSRGGNKSNPCRSYWFIAFHNLQFHIFWMEAHVSHMTHNSSSILPL